jgi:putative hydrolase of the HAD superfamily
MQKAHEPHYCPINAVIFDMDNTLFDFVEAKISACRAMLGYLDLSTDPREFFRYFRRPVHGFESHEHIRDFLNDTGRFSDEVFLSCCTLYEDKKLESIKPYPHIQDTLEFLKSRDLKLAIVTDAHNGNAKKRLQKAGLDMFFDCIISPDMSGSSKPAPDSFLLALQTLCVKPENTMLIGDSLRRDVEPGKKIGMITVYAAYGDRNFHECNECVPDFIVRDAREIAGLSHWSYGQE